MAMTGRTLGEYLDMGAAGRVALVHFVQCLGIDSALAREAGGIEAAEWHTRMKTNILLADLWDALQGLTYNHAAVHSKHRPKRPKPYPRPWRAKEEQRLGSDPIPVSKFWDWWDGKE